MQLKWTFPFITFLAASSAYSCFAQTPGTTSPASAAVDDSAPGWIWDHMSSCDSTGLPRVGAHAGGPGSSATYVFSGTGITLFGLSAPAVQVDNTRHMTGKLRVTIDGIARGDFSENLPGQSPNAALFSIHNLPNKNHALIVQPVNGWASVSGITIEQTSPQADVSKNTELDATNSIPNGVYRISPRGALDQCLDVYGSNTVNGSPVELYAYRKQLNQRYQLQKIGKGTYLLQPLLKPEDALCVLLKASDNTLYLGIWQYIGNPAQVWVISLSASGYYRLSPYNMPSTALSCGSLQTLGGDLSLQPYSGASNQDWKVVSIANDK